MTDPSAAPPPPEGGFAPPPPAAPTPGGFAPPPAPTAGAVGGGLALSSKGKRLGAALLEGLLMIVTLFIGWLIWWIILWSKAQTPAKQLLGMRIVKLDENRPASVGEMAMRELVGKVILGALPFYSLVAAGWVLFDDDNQALWDKLAGTTVVEDPDNRFGL